MSIPAIAVSPDLVADAGRRLSALTGSLDTVASHYRGPRAAPPLGDPRCTASYATAAHQIGGLVTAVAAQGRALAGATSAAAVLYATLDGGGSRHGGPAAASGTVAAP